jgi:hypothetical protein
VSDDECTEAGTTCNADGQQITCEEVQAGCFQVDEGTDPADCGTNQACVAGTGCVCNENPNCEAAGEFCTDDGVLTCTEDDDGCLINDDAVACADPTVCDPDAGGEGHAECVCPSVGTEPGTGCQGTAANTITCSGDDSDVIRCDLVGEAQCQVWVSLDNCLGDGLECNDNDCVCPDVTDTNEFFADPVVDRSGRPPEEITPTGARIPAICSFEEMSTAIAFAIDASGPGNIFDTFAIASNDTARAPRPSSARRRCRGRRSRTTSPSPTPAAPTLAARATSPPSSGSSRSTRMSRATSRRVSTRTPRSTCRAA